MKGSLRSLCLDNRNDNGVGRMLPEIVLGASVPIILNGRADSVRTRMASTAVGALYAHYLADRRLARESRT